MGKTSLVPNLMETVQSDSPVALIVLSPEEVLDLARFTQFSYISATLYPALSQLLMRVDRRARELRGEQPTCR